jgi:Uma2 family endonuclease
MTAVPWPPDHLLTLEEFASLPEDNTRRYELQDGVLIVTPRAVPLHQRATFNLMRAVEAQLPAPWIVLDDVEVVTQPGFPPGVRVPDMVIVPFDVLEANPARLDAEQVKVAVEVISPGSRRTDTVTKPAEYADAGIPHYWVVDLEPPVSLTAYHLAGEFGYQESPAVTGEFATAEPFPLRVDLAALTAPPSR